MGEVGSTSASMEVLREMVREVLREVLSGSSEDSSRLGLLGPEDGPGRRDGGPDHWNLCDALRES